MSISEGQLEHGRVPIQQYVYVSNVLPTSASVPSGKSLWDYDHGSIPQGISDTAACASGSLDRPSTDGSILNLIPRLYV